MAFFSKNSQDYANAIAQLVKPTYNSKYEGSIADTMDKIVNREKFSYDFNADPLYQNYKDQYTKLGNEAAMNAAAAVSANTGGFGNSYASTAASQANQQYLGQLNQVIPELYNAAMQKYQMETEDLYNQFGMYETEENRQYGQYRDSVSDYYSDWANMLSGYGTALGQENADRDYYYRVDRDTVSDNQWNQQFGLSNKQFEESMRQWQESFDYQKAQDAKQLALQYAQLANSKANNSKLVDENTGLSSNLIPYYQQAYNAYFNSPNLNKVDGHDGAEKMLSDLLKTKKITPAESDQIYKAVMRSVSYYH